MRASSSTPSVPSSIDWTMRWKDLTAGTDLRSWTYEMPEKNCPWTKYLLFLSTFSKRLIASS
jgi:hypothetical protein